MRNKLYVIVTGTDPNSKKGGIGFALPGYLHAMKSVNIDFESIPTYSPESFSGKYWWLLKSLPIIVYRLIRNRKKSIIIYSHAGAGSSLIREAIVLTVSKIFNAKTIIQLHAPEIDSYLNKSWKKKLFLLTIANADRLNVLLPWWQKRFTQAGIDKSVSILPNPLPGEWEKIAENQVINKKNEKEIHILVLARIEQGKGVDLVLESMVNLKSQFKLTIAGDGRLLNALKYRAEELDILDRVEFTGWISGEDKQKLIERSDIYCLPTSYDSFGMGFLEAMANGLPIVALDWGPISDIVPDRKVGFLVDKPEPELIADAIKKLSDIDIRIKMGSDGKKWVLEQFAAKKVGDKLNVIFEETLRIKSNE